MPQVLQETGYVLREVDNEQALQRLEILLLQICKAAEYSARVVVHGHFNMEPGQVRGQRVLHGGHAKVPVRVYVLRWPGDPPHPAHCGDCLAVFVLRKEVTHLHPETP
jgi:hypothetical protein